MHGLPKKKKTFCMKLFDPNEYFCKQRKDMNKYECKQCKEDRETNQLTV